MGRNVETASIRDEWLEIVILLIAIGICGYLSYIQRDSPFNPETWRRALKDSSPPKEFCAPYKKVPVEARAAPQPPPTEAFLPDFTATPEIVRQLSCGLVNNPDSAGYKPDMPEAPTASDVLDLQGVGKEGIDPPPYIHVKVSGGIVEVTLLSDLGLVHNGDQICVVE